MVISLTLRAFELEVFFSSVDPSWSACERSMASQSVDDWCAAILGEDPQLVSTSSGLHNLESLTVDDIDDSPRKMGTASSSTDVAMPTALDAPSVLEPCPEQPDLPPLVHEEDECPRVVQEELRQPSTPAAPAADDPILRDSVYRHWVPHIRDPLKALKELKCKGLTWHRDIHILAQLREKGVRIQE